MKINQMVNILVGLWGLTILIVFYWSFRSYDILEIKTQPYQTLKSEYAPGETFTFQADFCKKGNYKSTIIYQFLSDEVVYGEVKTESDLEKGCYNRTSYTVKVPDVPDGCYIARITNIYHPNPIREIRIPVETSEFCVKRPIPEVLPVATPSATVRPTPASVPKPQQTPNPARPENGQPQPAPAPVTNTTIINQSSAQTPPPQPTPAPSPEPTPTPSPISDIVNQVLQPVRDLLD